MGKSNRVLKIETFGGIAIRLSERRLSGFASRKAEAMLVYLASAGQAVPRSVLASLFWEQAPESRAATNLRVALSSLRKQLDPFLSIDRQVVRFRFSEKAWLDALALERHLADGDLEAGLALYRGDFLQGFHLHNCRSFEDWQTVMREHYLRRIRESLHQGVKRSIVGQALKDGLRYTRRLLDLDPYDEVALRRMLELLARTGQRNAAVQQFERYEKILAQDLGVAPDPATWDLFDRIRKGDIQPDPEVRLPGRANISARPYSLAGSLPESLTPFVGRQAELAGLKKMLFDPDVRLVTIFGPGGSGKTRLCQEIGKLAAGRFEDGVFFVPLDSIYDPEAVVSAIAGVFGFQPEESRQQEQMLLNFLASRNLLLLLDNFETVLQAAPLVAQILQRAAKARVITTSREKLSLVGEHIFPLGGLDFDREVAAPDEGLRDSSRLFLQTARRLNPQVPEDPPAIARICRLVEGMPLAIELAAAWTDTLSLQEIGDQIEAGLDILEFELGGLPARHQNIRLVFDATYLSLDPEARACFSALSVFRGSFTGRAAFEISGATIRLLKTLVRKSLLSLHENGRYQLHELLRQYGAEKLAETPQREAAVILRHSRFFVDYLTRIEKLVIGGRIAGTEKAQIISDLKNIRAGFRRAVKLGDMQAVLTYVPGLSALISQADLVNVLQWAIDRLQREGTSQETDIAIGHFLHKVGLARYHCGFPKKGRAEICESIAILEGARPASAAFLHEANLAAANTFAMGFDHDYTPLIQAAWESFRARYQIRTVLEFAGTYARHRGDFDQAGRHFQELLALAEPLYERRWLANAHFGLGLVAEDTGRFQIAIEHLQKSVLHYAEIDLMHMTGVTHKHLGMLHFISGKYDSAQHHFQQELALFQKLGVSWRMVQAYLNLGETMLAMESLKEAEMYYARAEKIYRQTQMTFFGGHLNADLGWLAIRKMEYPTAIKLFLSALEKPLINGTRFVLPHAMARAIPLLNETGHNALVRKIAAVILANHPGLHLSSKRHALAIMENIKSEQGLEGHDGLLAEARDIPIESLKAEFETALIALHQEIGKG